MGVDEGGHFFVVNEGYLFFNISVNDFSLNFLFMHFIFRKYYSARLILGMNLLIGVSFCT